jgi:predicted MFS family arabinose efflux permease
MFIFIEGAVVAGLAFMTEVAPTIRIQLLSATYSASQTGHMLGAVMGALLYQWIGFHMTALVSVTLIVVAYVCLLALFRLAPPSVRA